MLLSVMRVLSGFEVNEFLQTLVNNFDHNL